jgi:hypothetical protein
MPKPKLTQEQKDLIQDLIDETLLPALQEDVIDPYLSEEDEEEEDLREELLKQALDYLKAEI